MFRKISILFAIWIALSACSEESEERVVPARPQYDLLIRNGTLYDGSGGEPFVADVALVGDRIAAIGSGLGPAEIEIDATGLAVAPGFINVLSWANTTLIEDGRSMSDIRQGVTLEVMGEGWSMGPLNERMKRDMLDQQGDIRFDIEWTTLGEYLQFLQDRGVSTNVASFVGATSVRIHELGYEDRAPSAEELARMQDLVRTAMEEGALGVGSSLIYAPGFYADTDELVALNAAAAEYGGRYISHIRSEGSTLLEAVDELIEIARRAGVGAEIYHLKASGEQNWGKLESVFERIEEARAGGLDITADMYTYTAGATELTAAMPPWVQEGGLDAWVERLKDPAIRERLQLEMTTPTDQWESLYLDAGGAENVILIGFKNPELKQLTGKTVAEVAALRGTSPEVAMMDLVIEDHSPVSAVYFVMSEANIRKKIAQPWMSFGSDEASLLPEGAFLGFNPHPRAYGNFARLLGKYVRDERILSLAEAIRKLTSLPAKNLKIRDRGSLEEGFFADIVVFDPSAIRDHATFDEPHQLSTGVTHVFVNGEAVLRDGVHTGATPGRFVRGPGWSGAGVARVPSQIPKPGDWGAPKQILLKYRAPEPAWNANLPGTLDGPGQVVYFNGKYRLYYLAGDGNCSLSCDHYAGNENRSLGMLTADDPTGPWTEYGTSPLIRWSPNQCPEEGIFSLATIVDGPTLYIYYGAMTASDVQTPLCKTVSAGVRVAQTTDGFTFTGDAPVPFMDGAASAEPACTGCVLGDDDAEVYPVGGFKRASDGEFVLYYVSGLDRNLYVTHGPAHDDLGANTASDVAVPGFYAKQMSLIREDSDTYWMFLVQETGAPVRTVEVYRLEDSAPEKLGALLESYDENDGIAESLTSTIYRDDANWIWIALGCSECVCHPGLDGENYGDACFFDEYTVRSARRADARDGAP